MGLKQKKRVFLIRIIFLIILGEAPSLSQIVKLSNSQFNP
jgi:hypothetical protein